MAVRRKCLRKGFACGSAEKGVCKELKMVCEDKCVHKGIEGKK